ncbi:MAG: four helix bundle protein [Chloroflexi bacterium]|nr:four helix bundle protein [Chloroflexota bacterium]
MNQQFGHEKLDVYRLSLEYVEHIYQLSVRLKGNHRHARDQILRASQSIPLNIAEGNGRRQPADRRRFFDIARGSALECAATQDVLQVGLGISEVENRKGKQLLLRIVNMLTKLANAQTNS